MLSSRAVYPPEISESSINNTHNTGSTEEYPRENEMNTNHRNQLSAIFSPILIAMKLSGQFFGETAPAEIGRRRTGYISRFFSTLVVLGQWLLVVLSVISHFHIGFSSTPKFFFLLVTTIWYVQCASSTAVCLVVLPLAQNRRPSRFARFLSSFGTNAPVLEGMKEKAVKGLTLGCLAVLINTVVVTYFSVCYRGIISIFPPWYPHSDKYLAVRVIEVVFGTFDSFAWILPALIFCITCMLLEKTFETLQKKMSKESFHSFTIAHLRREHLKLCEMVELANAVFSPLLFVIVSLDIPLLCISFHQLIESASSQKDTIVIISYLYWSLCTATLLGVVFMFGSRVNEKAHSFYETLQKSKVSVEDIKENTELMLFLAHLRGDPIGLSVGGLAVISKSVFLTLFGLIVSYFIVLVTLPS